LYFIAAAARRSEMLCCCFNLFSEINKGREEKEIKKEIQGTCFRMELKEGEFSYVTNTQT